MKGAARLLPSHGWSGVNLFGRFWGVKSLDVRPVLCGERGRTPARRVIQCLSGPVPYPDIAWPRSGLLNWWGEQSEGWCLTPRPCGPKGGRCILRPHGPLGGRRPFGLSGCAVRARLVVAGALNAPTSPGLIHWWSAEARGGRGYADDGPWPTGPRSALSSGVSRVVG